MSQWLTNTLSRAAGVDDWLAPQRQHALELLKTTAWPTRKTEAWKYTSLRPLADSSFTVVGSEEAAAEGPQNGAIEGLDSLDIVIANGRLVSDLSALVLPAGVSINRLSESARPWVEQSFAKIKPERHMFGLINDALAVDGLVIDVEPGVSLTQPIRIVSHMSQGCEGHFRVLVRLGSAAAATIVEQFSGQQDSFLTAVTEFDVAESAALEHYRFALQTGAAMSVGGDHFRLGSKAQLKSTIVGFGSQLSRVDVDVHHAGEEANAELNAIYLLDGDETFDLHSTIEHAVAQCTTEENVRGIVAGSAKAVFNGRIHIHRNAQKTLAELNNRNLLMSRDAEINTKPELEIYADDVRCAHGATIAEIDKKTLYYLQSRGVSRTQAQIMLSFGFINELVGEMPSDALQEWLRPQLRERFAQMAAAAVLSQ